MKFLLAIVGLGLTWYYTQAKQFLQQYHVTFLTAKFNSARTLQSGLTKIYFTVRLNVNNPTQFSGKLKSAHIDFYFKDKLLGFAEKDETQIAPATNTIVEIPVSVNTLQLVSDVQEIYTAITHGVSIKFQLKGKLNFDAGTLNVNEEYKVALS